MSWVEVRLLRALRGDVRADIGFAYHSSTFAIRDRIMIYDSENRLLPV